MSKSHRFWVFFDKEDDKLTDNQWIEGVAVIMKTYWWLKKAGLRDSTEALIMDAQAQTLST